jgi:hypothetical protein
MTIHSQPDGTPPTKTYYWLLVENSPSGPFDLTTINVTLFSCEISLEISGFYI